MKLPRVKYIDYGIAFVTDTKEGRIIEINQALLLDHNLLDEVIQHENLHYYNERGIWYDIWIDIKDMLKFGKHCRLFLFCIRNPKAFLSNSLFYRTEEGIQFNSFMVLVFLFILAVWIVYKMLT